MLLRRIVNSLIIGVGILCMTANVFAQNLDEPTFDQTRDPLEKVNRVIFTFNDKMDEFVLRPVAKLYNKIVPHPLNRGIRNIFDNLSDLRTTGNDLLQANFYQATSDAWRLLINTTAGLGGTFDFASDIGLEPNYEDFGLTLARWGYTNSTYIVLPFFGPSTIRDTIGMPIDYYAFTIYPYLKNVALRNSIYGVNVVSQRAYALEYEQLLQQVAVDKYVFIRNAYLQKRASQIERNTELSDPYADPDEEDSDTIDTSADQDISNEEFLKETLGADYQPPKKDSGATPDKKQKAPNVAPIIKKGVKPN
ncbi:MAG: VacJ family lipoprotein [Gammaproteobacteria bacterium]